MIDSTTEPGFELPALASRAPVEHKVKSWPPFFEAALSGAKTHEIRRLTDRDYQVGDRLLLQEYDPATEVYSGRELTVQITYITSADAPCALSKECLHPDFCVLSIAKL